MTEVGVFHFGHHEKDGREPALRCVKCPGSRVALGAPSEQGQLWGPSWDARAPGGLQWAVGWPALPEGPVCPLTLAGTGRDVEEASYGPSTFKAERTPTLVSRKQAGGLIQWFAEFRPQSSSKSSPGELVTDSDPRAPAQTFQPSSSEELRADIHV